MFSFRWKRDSSGEKIHKDGKPVLEFVAIQRTDCSEWALPGVRTYMQGTMMATKAILY